MRMERCSSSHRSCFPRCLRARGRHTPPGRLEMARAGTIVIASALPVGQTCTAWSCKHRSDRMSFEKACLLSEHMICMRRNLSWSLSKSKAGARLLCCSRASFCAAARRAARLGRRIAACATLSFRQRRRLQRWEDPSASLGILFYTSWPRLRWTDLTALLRRWVRRQEQRRASRSLIRVGRGTWARNSSSWKTPAALRLCWAPEQRCKSNQRKLQDKYFSV